MRPFHQPFLAAAIPALMLAGCSQADKTSDSNAAAKDAAAAANDAPSEQSGPALNGAVAPGVAFSYNYAFTLPAKSISTVEQKHATACRDLGPSRCRVTGMRYEQPREGEVAGSLDFLLAPDLAHQFGSDAVGAVERASGKLDTAQVSGEDAGDKIKLSQSDSAGIKAEAERIEARLAAQGLAKSERAELERQLSELHGQLRGNVSERTALEASIATTPVHFAYASEGLLSGTGGTFSKAASASWSSAQVAFGVITVLAGIALPWALIALVVGLVWRSPDLRRGLRRIFGRSAAETTPPL